MSASNQLSEWLVSEIKADRQGQTVHVDMFAESVLALHHAWVQTLYGGQIWILEAEGTSCLETSTQFTSMWHAMAELKQLMPQIMHRQLPDVTSVAPRLAC